MNDCYLVSVLGSGQRCVRHNVMEPRKTPRFVPTFIYHERYQPIRDD